MKFNYRLLSLAVLLCMVPVMTYAWTQSFSYESAIPNAPVIDVRVKFGTDGFAEYITQFNGLYAGTGTAKLSGKGADCLIHIEIAQAGPYPWRRFTNLKVTGTVREIYINRCGSNKFKIQRELNGSYKLYKDSNAGYVAQSGEINL